MTLIAVKREVAARQRRTKPQARQVFRGANVKLTKTGDKSLYHKYVVKTA